MSLETINLAKYTVNFLWKIWLGSLADKAVNEVSNTSGVNLKLGVKKKVCVLYIWG